MNVKLKRLNESPLMDLMQKKIFIIFLILFNGLQLHSQEQGQDYYDPKIIRNEDFIYNEKIKSVRLHPAASELGFPVIRLNTEDKLLLKFDELDSDLKDYYYTFLHCTPDWENSNVIPSEYIDGYREDRISEYKYSFNTRPSYIHYRLEFPNEVIRPVKSGNYILKVYLKNDPEEVIITRRFMVIENRVEISAKVRAGINPEVRNYRQRVEFSINHQNYKIDNPFSNLQVRILQNGRWDNLLKDLKPTYVTDGELIYDPDNENEFDGGNEFRNFDIKSVKFPGKKIDKVYGGEIKSVLLFPDHKRGFQRFSTSEDINGNYVVRFDGASDEEADWYADYVNIEFNFEFPYPPLENQIYIFGKFTDYQNYGWAKMQYIPVSGGPGKYYSKVLLKQGFFDYQFGFYNKEKAVFETNETEGAHFETENDYSILVYNLEFGESLYKLVGYRVINSRNF